MPRKIHTFPGLPRHAAGVGLIEVLIAILVLGIGMLGIAAMQATTLRNSQGAMERSQAVMQTYGILDAMRANVAAARAEGYDIAMALPPCAAPAPTTLVTRDQNAWVRALQIQLGTNACGAIDCAPPVAPATASVCTIRVAWDDQRGGGTPPQILTTTSLL